MGRRASVAVAIVAVGALPGSAHAADAQLEARGVYPFEGRLVALAGQRVGVAARVADAYPGTPMVLSWSVGGRIVRARRHQVATGSEVRDSLRVRRAGAVVVRASFPGVPPPSGARTRPLRVSAIAPAAARGARGLRVRFLQRRLAELGYAVPLHGVYDVKTRFAVVAFRKVNRMRRVTGASRAVFSAVARGRGGYRARFPAAGRHVEFDRRRQVLALVEPGGSVFRVYHSSSGRPRFRTPLGSFRFWRKEPGMNSRSMLHTVYFTHAKRSRPTRPACGIHGYFAVPTHPYSHCCLRVGTWNALFIHRWVRLGERVYVYA